MCSKFLSARLAYSSFRIRTSCLTSCFVSLLSRLLCRQTLDVLVDPVAQCCHSDLGSLFRRQDHVRLLIVVSLSCVYGGKRCQICIAGSRIAVSDGIVGCRSDGGVGWTIDRNGEVRTGSRPNETGHLMKLDKLWKIDRKGGK